MNPTSFLRAAAALALAAASVSCGDDPELVRQRDEQKAEIRKLEGELAILQERMEQAPPDRGADLARLKEEASRNQQEIEVLETEVAELEKRKAEIDAGHQAYRRKYVVR